MPRMACSRWAGQKFAGAGYPPREGQNVKQEIVEPHTQAHSGALSLPDFRWYLVTNVLAMMADNIEHVISYWVAFNKFHSAALGGFAVLSHWIPYLAFAFSVGALNDRFDSRRLIQLGMALFMCVSLAWGYFFVTDTLTMPAAMILLTLHGCAGVFWTTSSQVILHDIVGGARLQSAVRLSATGRYLGVLVGPAVGGALMLALGPSKGIFVNACFYLPCFLWMMRAPYGPKFRPAGAEPPKRAVKGFADLLLTVREVRALPAIASMVALAGCASFFVGNSYQAQMPGFATDLGLGGKTNPGAAYSVLLAADAAGALLGGVLLETMGSLLPTTPKSAIRLALCWAVALGAFALSHTYALSIVLLFAAGFFELSFSSMAMSIVQMNAPAATRGRVLGLYGMSALGLRAGAGITVGLVGSAVGIHTSLCAAAAVFAVVSFTLMRVLMRRAEPA